MFSTTVLIEDLKLVKNPSWVALTMGQYPFILIIINIRGQIENRPLQNTRSAGRKRLTADC